MSVRDLRGQVFERWTVLEEAGRNKSRVILWKCLCLCGTIKILPSTQLRNKSSKSCGCLQRELAGNRRRLPKGIAERNRAFGMYRRSAKEQGYVFELTLEDFTEITALNCFYCNAFPTPYSKNKDSNGEFIANGIDRVDNTKGYTKDNSVPCCFQCNSAKKALSKKEFLSWAVRLVEYQFNIKIENTSDFPYKNHWKKGFHNGT